MSKEWTEETVLPYMFKEVELRDEITYGWGKFKLIGFDRRSEYPFRVDGGGFKYMRPIPEKKKRLMKPEELWDKAILTNDTCWVRVKEILNGKLFVGNTPNPRSVQELEDHSIVNGWADHPTSCLNESFYIEEES